MDKNGVHVLKTLLEFGTLDDKSRTRIYESVKGKLSTILSQNKYGSLFVETILERFEDDHLSAVNEELCDVIDKLCRDKFGNLGNHIEFIVRVLCKKPESQNRIMKNLKGNFIEMSQCENRSFIVQKILEYGTEDNVTWVLNEVTRVIEKLAWSRHGTMVITQALKYGRTEEKRKIVNILKGRFRELCNLKIGSHVIRAILVHCTEDDAAIVLHEILESTEKNVLSVHGILFIKDIVEHAEPQDLSQICWKLKGKLGVLSCNKYGAQLVRVILDHCTEDQMDLIYEELCKETRFVHSHVHFYLLT